MCFRPLKSLKRCVKIVQKTCFRSHFKFVADRLIRMVIEEGLNQLPFSEIEVVTPTGCNYKVRGLKHTPLVFSTKFQSIY